MRKISNWGGFTLVEVLVVIGVLSIVGVLVLTIFSSSLRGNNKSQILISIKQNGQSVLENMTSNIRNADNLVCISSTPASTLVIVKNGAYTRFRVILKENSALAQQYCNSANGCIVMDFPAQPPPPSSKAVIKTFIDNVCTDPIGTDSSELPRILTDNNLQNGVSLTSGSFTLDKQAGFKDGVKINFSLSAATEALPSVAGQIDPVTFETTIQLR